MNGWEGNLETAQAISIKTGKPILANFTGTDWCGWCIRLKKEVFVKDEFIKSLEEDIAKEFVKTENPKPVLGPPKVSENTNTSVLDNNPPPIRVLFNKQKKNNKVKLILEFPVNIPTKGVYELMSTSFDKKEVNEQLQSFILDQLSEDEILDCLHNSVQSLIESKYKGE